MNRNRDKNSYKRDIAILANSQKTIFRKERVLSPDVRLYILYTAISLTLVLVMPPPILQMGPVASYFNPSVCVCMHVYMCRHIHRLASVDF